MGLNKSIFFSQYILEKRCQNLSSRSNTKTINVSVKKRASVRLLFGQMKFDVFIYSLYLLLYSPKVFMNSFFTPSLPFPPFSALPSGSGRESLDKSQWL